MVDKPQPKAGDTVIFPSGRREKIHSVFEEMVWLVSPHSPDKMSDPIPKDDLVRSGEPDTWVFKE
jgi:hypothetical protein